MNVNLIQTNFTAGELSPLMWGHTDMSQYYNGVELMENFLIKPQGAASRRPGSRFVVATKDSSRKSRLLPFKFSTLQAYQLEFGHQYIRVNMNHGQVQNILAVVNGTFTSDLSSWTTLNSGTGAVAYSAGVASFTSSGGGNEARLYQSFTNPGVGTYTVSCDTNGAITWKVGTTAGGTEIATGTTGSGVGQTFQFTLTTSATIYLTFQATANRTLDNVAFSVLPQPYEIPSPYTEDQVGTIVYTQSADTLYLAHNSVAQQKLTRSGHASWAFTTIDFIDGPYLDANTDSTKTLTPSATTGAITITAVGHSPFAVTDIGRLVRIAHSAKWGAAKITGFTSATVVSATVQTNHPFNGTTAVADWRLGSWNSVQGYPGTVCFYEQRLGWGGNLSEPQRFWLSMSGNFETYSPTVQPSGGGSDAVTDSCAISYTLSSDEVNAIQWMMGSRTLVVGTKDSEWSVSSGVAQSPLTPTNIQARQQSNVGSATFIRPIRSDRTILFPQTSGKKLYEFGYDFYTDQYSPADTTLLSDHILEEQIKEACLVKQPNNIVWTCLQSGHLVALTYLSSQKVIAWHRHPIGGTGVVVESVSATPAPDGSYDEVWMIVKRTVNGTTVRYIEYLDKEFKTLDPTDKDDAFFVDCGLTYSGSPATQISGLSHLIGETVDVLANGAVRPQCVVDGTGKITLASSASKVQVGLHYESKLRTLGYEFQQSPQSSASKKKRVYTLTPRFYNSLGGKYGYDDSSMHPIYYRKSSTAMDASAPLFSGPVKLPFSKGFGLLPQTQILQDQPLPMTITSLAAEVTFEDA